ncbi:MAG: AmmeMemoRadiSam system protein B [Desulfobacterales bacterium]|nr:AmmeMemoRadiSam system protein B [Desulfobacterales bacterium]
MKKCIFVYAVSLLCLVTVRLTFAELMNPFAIQQTVSEQQYPLDSRMVLQAINGLLADAVPSMTQKPVMIIAPHGKWMYAGQIMADAYKQVANQQYDHIILLGINQNTTPQNGFTLMLPNGLITPLGIIEIDQQLANQLIQSSKHPLNTDTVTRKVSMMDSHLPLIKFLFPNTPVLPILVNETTPELCSEFGKNLAKVIQNQHVLIIVSSLFAQLSNNADTYPIDKILLTSIDHDEPHGIHNVIQQQKTNSTISMCVSNEGGILVGMSALKSMGVPCMTWLSYVNKSDIVLGNSPMSVGQAAVMFTLDTACEKKSKDIAVAPHYASHNLSIEQVEKQPYKSLNQNEQHELLAFARKSLTQYTLSQTLPLARFSDVFTRNHNGAIVILRTKGELIALVGHLGNEKSLGQLIGALTHQAIRQFGKPIMANDLKTIEIEVGVIRSSKQLTNTKDFKLNRDGLAFIQDNRSVFFIPKTDIEKNDSKKDILKELCESLAQPSDCWKKQTYVFQADIFKETTIKP